MHPTTTAVLPILTKFYTVRDTCTGHPDFINF